MGIDVDMIEASSEEDAEMEDVKIVEKIKKSKKSKGIKKQ